MKERMIERLENQLKVLKKMESPAHAMYKRENIRAIEKELKELRK